MPITAARYRTRTFKVPVPDTDPPDEFICRYPAPGDLIAENLFPLEVYGDIIEKANAHIKGETTFEPVAKSLTADVQTSNSYIDKIVSMACVDPPVVLTDADADAHPDALHIREVDNDVKLAIFQRALRNLGASRVSAAVREFRHRQSVDRGTGSDSATVRDETLVTVG